MDSRQGKEIQAWYRKWENYLVIFGFVIIIVGVVTPFLIMYFNDYKYNLNSFEVLGTVGDFFGGTTVGLFSLASLMFVTAAMFMQKEELKLQRDEVKETRKEYSITNSTMQKQSFNSTFFSMINLHHNILENIKYSNSSSREAIAFVLSDIREETILLYRKFKFESHISDKELKGILCNAYNLETQQLVHQELLELADIENWEEYYVEDAYDKIFNSYVDTSIDSMEENDLDFIEPESVREIFEKRLRDLDLSNHKFKHKDSLVKELLDIVNRFNCKDCDNILKDDYKIPLDDNQWIEFKKQKFILLWENYENLLGHYYRNFYLIIDYIHNAPESINKKEYYGILKAQLSLDESVLFYYYVNNFHDDKTVSKELYDHGFFERNKNYLLWNDESIIE